MENVLSSRIRSLSNADVGTIWQHLHQLESDSHAGTCKNMVVGLQDYDPTGGLKGAGAGAAQWAELEMQTAVGVRGALRENFVQSVQVINNRTHNSQMHFTVVKGVLVRDKRCVSER